MKKLIGLSSIMLVAIALLSACGFHLRGKVELPPEMNKVFVQTDNVAMASQLKSALKSSGAVVVASDTAATAILKIGKASESRSVRSVGGSGRVREFTLGYTVEFSIKAADGKVLMKKQVATLTREFSFNETQVVGKSVEESIIRGEMRRQMISEILRRIQRHFKSLQHNASVKSKADSNSGTVTP